MSEVQYKKTYIHVVYYREIYHSNTFYITDIGKYSNNHLSIFCVNPTYYSLLQCNVFTAQESPFLLCVSAEPLSIIQGAAKLCHLLHQILTALHGGNET